MSTTDALELGLTFALVGMIVVFSALGAIALLVAALNRWSDRVDARLTPAPPAPDAGLGVEPATVAILTAAATAALRRPVRVRSVRQNP